jgi:hypothetical protein
MQQLAIETEHVRKQTTTERDRISHDRLEYRLRDGRRGTDHAKNVSRRRQLLARLVTLTL